jgi:hypothetical protein
LKLFQKWEKWGIKENNEEGDFNYDIFNIIVRTFVNATMYLHQAQQFKEEEEEEEKKKEEGEGEEGEEEEKVKQLVTQTLEGTLWHLL